MKKLLNGITDFVPEMLEGMLFAYPDLLKHGGDDLHCLIRADAPVQGKVALVSGGGSGHLPVFHGYVGKGMLDGCAVGDVFASPSAEVMLEVAKHVDGGKGVLFIYANYHGDRMNFEMAAEMAELEDMTVRTVVIADDVAAAPKGDAKGRRGVAGMVFAFKVAGAKADQGADIDEVVAVAEKILERTGTMGVALSPVTVPRAGKPTFTIGDDEMEIGMGIHGEQGIKREKLQTADEVATRLVEAVLADIGAKAGERVAVMVNGMGATPYEELYILYRKVHLLLQEAGLSVHRSYVGEYATSMEMAGASVSIAVVDDELAALLDHPAKTPFFVQ